MRYVLGFDGGGTKTACLLLDEKGEVISRGTAAGANYQRLGVGFALSSLTYSLHQCLQPFSNRIQETPIAALGLGLAGAGRPSDRQIIAQLVEQLIASTSLNWVLQPENIVITDDASTALLGGLSSEVGIVAIAGTGSLVFGRNAKGETKRVGGWGPTLGDEGSAYQIAMAALQAVVKAEDGIGPTTKLHDLLMQRLNLANLSELVEVVYRRSWGAREIAALAPLVDQAAREGDQVAAAILDHALQQLVKATCFVKKSLFSLQEEVEVVTAGGVWQSRIRNSFEKELAARSLGLKLVKPRHEPAYGAALLALKTLT